MKPVLMIHEFKEEFLELPLEQYILTFDDGLYSQYYYWPSIQKIPTKKVFFISSGIICDQQQSLDFPDCRSAHKKAFSGNKEDYMTLAQIKELAQDPLVEIGGHSHSHTRLTNFNSLLEKVSYIKSDTEQMLEWFKENLDLTPTAFCFPYNNDLDGFYRGLLKKFGIVNFFGAERTPIEKLLHSQHQLDTHGA